MHLSSCQKCPEDITQSQRLHRLAQYAQEVFSPQQMAQHLANHVLREHSAKLLKIFLMLACLKLLHAQLASKERTAKLLEATKILVRNAFQGAIVLLLRQIVMVSAKPVLLGSIPAAKEHLPTQLASHAMIGTYSEAVAATAVDVCKSCPTGYYSNRGDSFCRPCFPGLYSNLATRTCEECPAGFHQESPAQVSCERCLGGKFAFEPGFIICNDCPAGWKQRQLGAISCSSCRKGYFQNVTGQSMCGACPKVFYTESEKMSFSPALRTGLYSPDVRASSCKVCPAAFFAPNLGSFGCTRCHPGTYAPKQPQVLCQLCEPGKYQNERESIL